MRGLQEVSASKTYKKWLVKTTLPESRPKAWPLVVK